MSCTLAGPALMGALAGTHGLRTALVVTAALSALALTVRPRRTAPRVRESRCVRESDGVRDEGSADEGAERAEAIVGDASCSRA